METNIYQKNETIENLLNHKLNVLLRWGIAIIASVVLMVGALLWFMPWPETLATPVSFSGAETLNIDVSGYKLPHYNGQMLHKNELIAAAAGKALHAPLDGQAYLETTANGSQVLHLIPANRQVSAQVLIPQSAYTRTAAGQEVQLRFDSYPFETYGYLSGRLQSISPVPTEAGYIGVVTFPQGFTTSKGKQLMLTGGLHASADIVLEKQRLLHKLLANISGSWRP